jgi:hypothetical protein
LFPLQIDFCWLGNNTDGVQLVNEHAG